MKAVENPKKASGAMFRPFIPKVIHMSTGEGFQQQLIFFNTNLTVFVFTQPNLSTCSQTAKPCLYALIPNLIHSCG